MVIARPRLKKRCRVWYDDGSVVDLTDRIKAGPKRTIDIDSGDWSCSITFDNAHDLVYKNLSLDPLDQLSTLNLNESGEYEPLLSCNHRVFIEVDKGDGWEPFFDGYAGGGVSGNSSSRKRHAIDITLDGKMMPLKERNRLTKISYEDRDLATSLLRSILLDSGFTPAHIVVLDDPMVQVDNYTTKETSTWNAIQNLIAKTGYVIASRYHESGVAYNDGSGESTPEDGFYLTLYNPDRSKDVVDWAWDQECTHRRVNYGISDVRTWAQVCYEDSTGRKKCTQSISNPESRAKYGIPAGDGSKLDKRIRLVEDNNSLVRNMEDAIKYRDASFHDLEWPSPDTEIDIDQYWDDPQLHDFVEFEFRDYTVDIGITRISVDISPDKPCGKTSFAGVVNRVIGLRNYWLGQEMSEDELTARRLNFLTGGLSRLDKPEILHTRRYAQQGSGGEMYGAVVIQWKRIDAWWYGFTEIYVSVGDDKHFGASPFMTARGTSAVVAPLPVDQKIAIRIRHIPNSQITRQGQRG